MLAFAASILASILISSAECNKCNLYKFEDNNLDASWTRSYDGFNNYGVPWNSISNNSGSSSKSLSTGKLKLYGYYNITKKVIGPGNVSFLWGKNKYFKMNTKLFFTIDGRLNSEYLDPNFGPIYQDPLSFGPGTHNITWSFEISSDYSKGGVSGSNSRLPQDSAQGWIDEVEICENICNYEIQPNSNKKPSIYELQPDILGPQESGVVIKWTAQAMDTEQDLLLFRFLLNGNEVQGWSRSNNWTWNTIGVKPGEYKVEVWVRDGNHEGVDGFDDRKSNELIVKRETKNLSVFDQTPMAINLISNKASPQEAGEEIRFIAKAANSENYSLLYRFVLNGHPARDWSDSNTWTWQTNDTVIGTNLIEVQVNCGKNTSDYINDCHKNLSFEVGMSVHENDSMEKVFEMAKLEHVAAIFINDGRYNINNTLRMDRFPTSLIGKSKNVTLYPALSQAFSTRMSDGIYLDSPGCRIVGINFCNFSNSIIIYAPHCFVSNNIFTFNNMAIQIYGSNNNISNNRFNVPNDEGNEADAIYVGDTNHINIYNNDINGGIGIEILNGTEGNITHNNIYGKYGISLEKSKDIEIELNNISCDESSIWLLTQTFGINIAKNNMLKGQATDENQPKKNIWDNNYWGQTCTRPRRIYANVFDFNSSCEPFFGGIIS